MDAEYGNEDTQSQVERDEELVQAAFWSGEETIHETSKGYGNGVHGSGRPNQNELPHVGVGCLPFL